RRSRRAARSRRSSPRPGRGLSAGVCVPFRYHRGTPSPVSAMARLIRPLLLSIRDLFVSAGPFVLLAVALLVLAYHALDPMPPRHVRLATGPEQSAYEAIGARYQERLARLGITVELVPTAGSRDNFERLLADDPGQRVDFGFVQGGTASPERAR